MKIHSYETFVIVAFEVTFVWGPLLKGYVFFIPTRSFLFLMIRSQSVAGAAMIRDDLHCVTWKQLFSDSSSHQSISYVAVPIWEAWLLFTLSSFCSQFLEFSGEILLDSGVWNSYVIMALASFPKALFLVWNFVSHETNRKGNPQDYDKHGEF